MLSEAAARPAFCRPSKGSSQKPPATAPIAPAAVLRPKSSPESAESSGNRPESTGRQAPMAAQGAPIAASAAENSKR